MGKRSLRWAGVAVAPWLLACGVTLMWAAVFGNTERAVQSRLRELFSTPDALIPAVIFLALAGLELLTERPRLRDDPDGVRLDPPDARFVRAVGLGVFSILSIALLGAAWGGTWGFAYQLLWTVYSGYAVFVVAAVLLTSRPPVVSSGLSEHRSA